MTDKPLTIYVMRDDDAYMAQCLEYDISTQAPDMDTLFSRMTALLRAEMAESKERTGVEFGGLSPAPRYFSDAAELVNNTLQSDGVEFKIAA
jgi:hypothetical protein